MNSSSLTSPIDDTTAVVDRYIAVWNEPDASVRRRTVAALWSDTGVEYVEGARFTGHDELDARITHAYKEFVGSGKYVAACGEAPCRHGEIVCFTITLDNLLTGETDWAARVFLYLDDSGQIREDYQLTTVPLTAQ